MHKSLTFSTRNWIESASFPRTGSLGSAQGELGKHRQKKDGATSQDSQVLSDCDCDRLSGVRPGRGLRLLDPKRLDSCSSYRKPFLA